MIKYKASGGNGITREDAIIINSPDEVTGVNAEYAVLAEMYGDENIDWVIKSQRLIKDGKEAFDIMTLDINGAEYEVWFNISDFYGKL